MSATGPVRGRKDDAGKPRWDLLPIGAVREVVRVLTHGADRYGDDNWRRVEDGRRRYYAAALRHLTSWWEGERADPDTGFSHLAHAASCLLFLLGLEEVTHADPR